MKLKCASPDESYIAAQEFAASGRYADAIRTYSSAINGDPNHIAARVGRGMAFQQIGEHLKAIVDFDKVISCYPDWPGTFVAYYGRARSRLALGQNYEAIEDCDQAISRNPTLTDAFYLRGTARKAVGYIDAAISDMDAVLIADPCYHEAYHVRGSLHLLRQRWEQAIEDLSMAIEQIAEGNPNVRDCFYLRGIASQEIGEHRAAIADFSRTIAFGPNDGRPYLRRSRSYHEIGETALSNKDFQTGTYLMHDQ